MNKKYIWIFLAIFILVSNISFAEGNHPILSVKTFDEAKLLFKNLDSSFENQVDAENYLNTYWKDFFPRTNENGINLNYEYLVKKGMIIYGDESDVSGNTQTEGEWLYLGQNINGGGVTNLSYKENKMINPEIIIGEEGVKSHSGVVKRFTKWNDRLEVGLKLNATNTINEGQKAIELWMKNIKNRLPEFHNGEDFYKFMSVDDMLKTFVIQFPPTHRTYGLATAWFRHDGGITHRTFLIDKIGRFDLSAESFEYIDNSKTIRIGYNIKGIDKIEEVFDITLYMQSKEDIENKFIYTGLNEIVLFDSSVQVYHVKLTEIIRDNINKDIVYLDFDLSPYLKDVRKEEIEVIAYINYLQLIEEDDYSNNIVSGVIPPTSNELDFSIHDFGTSSVIKERENAIIKLVANLKNSKELNTTVNLYNDKGVKISDKSILVKPNEDEIMEFNISGNNLKEGNNTFYAVINADFNLTESNPVKNEKDLTNNKIAITINVIKDLPDISQSCEFRKNGDTRIYKNRYCSWWFCYTTSHVIELKQSAKMEYVTNDLELRSDNWTNDILGQRYRPDMIAGKDLNGNPAKDEAMRLAGINPLKQIIRTGHGIEVRGKIRITGKAQEFDNFDHTKIEDFINFIEKNMYVVGYNVRNNNGEYSQKLEVDKNRSSEYKKIIKDTTIETYGNYVTQKVYTTDFEVEIPVIITKATG